MDAWQWFITVGIAAVASTFMYWFYRFQKGLQDTIDHLRSRLDQTEKDIRECLADRAALRQELADLKERK